MNKQTSKQVNKQTNKYMKYLEIYLESQKEKTMVEFIFDDGEKFICECKKIDGYRYEVQITDLSILSKMYEKNIPFTIKEK